MPHYDRTYKAENMPSIFSAFPKGLMWAPSSISKEANMLKMPGIPSFHKKYITHVRSEPKTLRGSMQNPDRYWPCLP